MYYQKPKTKKLTKQVLKKRRKSLLRGFFNFSKALHKYIGLILLLFLAWMSFSGIFMNHPNAIGDISVDKSIVPGHYHLSNWNRSTLTDAAYIDESTAFFSGRQGIWKSTDGGRTFADYMDGNFPGSPYWKKTRDIHLDKANNRLFAATAAGLFTADINTGDWRKIPAEEKYEDFKKIVDAGGRLLAFSKSHIYELSQVGALSEIKTARHEPEPQMSMVDLFFELHGGDAWGLPGKLIYDAAGLITIFLCISAFYIWFYPKKLKWFKGKAKKRTSRFKIFYKYHLKLGIWSAFILLIIAGTGLFMRPPLLVALVGEHFPMKYYPGIRHDNPWHDKIRNAMYDPVDDEIIIDATDGYWVGDASLEGDFRKQEPPIPIFPMGATVFEVKENGNYLIGSFIGLHSISRETGRIRDVISSRDTAISESESVRPGDHMITGYFETHSGERFVTTHNAGLFPVNAASAGRFKMPDRIAEEYRMPLWNYMFEIHNARFFEGIIGNWYIIVVPFGSLLFIILILTGIYDWIFDKIVKRRLK